MSRMRRDEEVDHLNIEMIELILLNPNNNIALI